MSKNELFRLASHVSCNFARYTYTTNHILHLWSKVSCCSRQKHQELHLYCFFPSRKCLLIEKWRNIPFQTMQSIFGIAPLIFVSIFIFGVEIQTHALLLPKRKLILHQKSNWRIFFISFSCSYRSSLAYSVHSDVSFLCFAPGNWDTFACIAASEGGNMFYQLYLFI